MGKRLFVGGLPYQIDDNKLRDLFSQAGAVESAIVVMDRMTRTSKGFGFVEMATEEDAQKAIKALHDSQVEGRKIAVNEARPLEERPQRDFGGGGGRSGGFQNRSGGGNPRRDNNRNSRTQRW
mgnify:CR=1 FL=1